MQIDSFLFLVRVPCVNRQSVIDVNRLIDSVESSQHFIMQTRIIFVLLATVTMPSASLWCCAPERKKPEKEVKKAPGAHSLKTNSDFPANIQSESSDISEMPLSMRTMPEIHPTGSTMTLAARNEITSVDTTDSYKKPFESIPESQPIVSVPMSLSSVERIDGSTKKDTANILNPSSNSVPMETKSRSLEPVMPLTSHILNPQLNEGNENNGLSADKSNPMPIKQMITPQDDAKPEINHEEVPKIPMPPATPKLPTFLKAGISAIQNNGPMENNQAAKSPPVAPPMPPKMPSNKISSMGLSHAAVTAGRAGLRPAQTQNSNLKPTQLYGKPQLGESERHPFPIKAAEFIACKKTLKPLSQAVRSGVIMPETIQGSYKQMQTPQEAKPTSTALNGEGSGVRKPARRFDKPKKTPSNPIIMNELAMVKERRNRLNNVDWEKFDKIARKL